MFTIRVIYTLSLCVRWSIMHVSYCTKWRYNSGAKQLSEGHSDAVRVSRQSLIYPAITEAPSHRKITSSCHVSAKTLHNPNYPLGPHKGPAPQSNLFYFSPSSFSFSVELVKHPQFRGHCILDDDLAWWIRKSREHQQ